LLSFLGENLNFFFVPYVCFPFFLGISTFPFETQNSLLAKKVAWAKLQSATQKKLATLFGILLATFFGKNRISLF